MSKWIKKLDEWAEDNSVTSSTFCVALDGLEKEIAELRKHCEAMAEANKGLLTNFACDWYVEMMYKSEAPSITATGIAAKIHNKELANRTYIAIDDLRQALKAYEKFKEGE